MAITVYWASMEREWLLAEEPQSVASRFYKKGIHDANNPGTQLNFCPSFNGYLKNLYTMKSLFTYDFQINGNEIGSSNPDPEVFDRHVLIRDAEKKVFSFKQCYIFFTEEKSLEVTFYEYPALEDNNITKRCMIPAGKFDIAKWFRNSEFAFILKDGFNEFKIEKGEVYSYIRFHTDEKINFQQFRMTDKSYQYARDCFYLQNSRLGQLVNYYKTFKSKKLVLKEIKENLV
jgi:hypothetical protein